MEYYSGCMFFRNVVSSRFLLFSLGSIIIIINYNPRHRRSLLHCRPASLLLLLLFSLGLGLIIIIIYYNPRHRLSLLHCHPASSSFSFALSPRVIVVVVVVLFGFDYYYVLFCIVAPHHCCCCCGCSLRV